MIKCDNLRHIYAPRLEHEQSVLALDGINLHIAKGEFVALLGGNGSGKSTLAKHFNALLLPTTGACFIDGLLSSDINNLWDIRKNCGMVFQNPDNQIVAAIVEEDVAFGPENLGVPSNEIKERVIQALSDVGMLEYREHAPHLLSGGQKQRVAIAGALAMDALCLVLDEPTAMLDPGGRQEVLRTLLRLKRNSNKTIILITHFMDEAMLADRVVVMNSGKVVLDGIPSEVFTNIQELLEAGLEAPLAGEVAALLRERGVALPDGIVCDKDLLESLCR